VGASTGGFSDCLLQHGAARVFAVDVGHGQLAQKLRDDPRVVVMERTNARYLEKSAFGAVIDVVVVDASFIGLDKLLPAIATWLDPGGRLLALIKPQFEAGREAARKGRGVIRDPEVRSSAITAALAAVRAAGFEITGECDSAVPGPKGNVEHFVLARRNPFPSRRPAAGGRDEPAGTKAPAPRSRRARASRPRARSHETRRSR
jgi:23S rRNA (cytidine1920-2'-O)/16S rRNA (cytidine1409-2'-O)-methyltransferase